MYEIKTISSPEEIGRGNTAPINIYNWGGDYRPETTARLCFLPGEGFLLKMETAETDPRAEHTEQNSRVCDDSCLEFFANFAPERGDGYLNCEGNANGALLCCYGTVVYPRKTVESMGLSHPLPKVFRTAASWGYTLFLPLPLLEGCFGPLDLKTGSHIRGSFYKCGDKTARPHFGSYTRIDFERPNFHRPESFADMVITD